MLHLAFQPWHALVGGMSLGVLSAGNTLITGRVLGISGTIKGWIQGNRKAWRALFVAGLYGAGCLASQFIPGSFDTLPPTYTVARAVAAGLMVGAGAVLGNGCTSGHGIAGNARLSLRSLVYTCTFFVSGIAACAATGTMAAIGVASVPPPLLSLAGADLTRGLIILGTCIAGTAAAAAVVAKTKDKQVGNVFDAFAGVMFGLGLSFAGMTRPSMVASALAALQPGWNFTLWFVMGGAIAVALPLFQLYLTKRSHALDGSPLSIQPSTKIDWMLIAGGVLFGAGWGAGGMCPGPAIVALAHPQKQVVALVSAMIAGMALGDEFVKQCGFLALSPSPASAALEGQPPKSDAASRRRQT